MAPLSGHSHARVATTAGFRAAEQSRTEDWPLYPEPLQAQHSDMSTDIRTALRQLILEHGHTLAADPRRCEAMLKDLCPDQPREINLAINALREQIAADLLAIGSGEPLPMRIARLTRRLEDHLSLKPEAAAWAVETWALALGAIDLPLSDRPPDPLPPPPPPSHPTQGAPSIHGGTAASERAALFPPDGPPMSPEAGRARNERIERWREEHEKPRRAKRIALRHIRVPEIRVPWYITAWLTPFAIGITSALLLTGHMPNQFTFFVMLTPAINWLPVIAALIVASMTSPTEAGVLILVSSFWVGIAYFVTRVSD
jgi:hypothetical protein